MLGKTLVHVGRDGVRRSGRIVETEAYVGPDDLASHARVGPKGRATLMYGLAGVAYVYLVYGMHHCFNAVTEQEGYPGAVLVRAIEPLDSAERGNGPALVCRALNIDRTCNGVDLTSSDLFLEDGETLSNATSFISVLSLPVLLDGLVPQLAQAVDGNPATPVERAAAS